MIKSITLKNFFSFEEQTVRLNPKVNLLVGINGSGKSNFIKAFELLRFGINEGNINHLFGAKWNGKQVWNYHDLKKEQPIQFDFSLLTNNFSKNGNGELDEIVYKFLINKSLSVNEKIETIKGTSISTLENDAWHTNKLLDESWVIKDRKIGRFKNFLKQIEIYESIDISDKGAKRRNNLEERDAYDRLSSTFDNLAGLLNTMSIKPETEEAFDKIYKSINDINVNLEEIKFGLDSNQNLYIQINNLSPNVLMGLENISDGTIKFLVLMSILYNPNRGNIVCIEEPENHLHPDMINMVAKGIKHASKTSQMIISTHSPFLLNAFELEDILVFENDEKNNTIVKELSQDDFEDWTDDYVVGSLWLNGLIGGKRW